MKTNIYGSTINYLVFKHRLQQTAGGKLPPNEKVRELLVAEICRNAHETLINKLLDIEQMVFYAAKTLQKTKLEITYQSAVYQFDLVYDGDLKDNFLFMRCMYRSLLYKSQMIEIDDYYVNPFDIKETDEVSIIPAYRFDFVQLHTSNFISVGCDILFSPNLHVLEVLDRLASRGIDASETKRLLTGKIVQTVYQSWTKYYKIVDILFDQTVQQSTFGDSHPRSIFEHVHHKYPHLHIGHPQQCTLVGVAVNNRFESIREQKRKFLIPELLKLVITNEEMVELFSIDYFKHCKINKRAMKYYYINRFMNSFVDKPQIRLELMKWRINIDRQPQTMGFHPLDFSPTLSMKGPNGLARIERNLTEQESSFYENVLENRPHSFSPIKKVNVVFARELSDKVQKVLFELKRCFEHFKYTDVQPDQSMIDRDSPDCWLQFIGEKLSTADANRLTLCITKDEEVEFRVRDALMKNNEVFKVICLRQSEEFKFDCFKAHHLILQVNQLIGGMPWTLNELSENNPIIFSSILFRQVEGCKYIVSFSFSWNKFFTKYQSKMCILSIASEADAVTQLREFLSRCKSVLTKQGVPSQEYCAVVYFQIDVKHKLYSSFDRYQNFEEVRVNSLQREQLMSIFKQSIDSFGQKSLVSVECTVRTDINIFPSSRSSEKMDKTTIEYYTDFSQYAESREYLHDATIPACLTMEYASSSRFLMVSRFSLLDGTVQDEPCIADYNIFHCVNVLEENVKKWIVTNTVLHGCLDYDNIDKYVCLPVCVLLAQRAISKMSRDASKIDEEKVLTYNRYLGIPHLT